MARTGPPAYAWDWFARQRLLWREARSRLVHRPEPVAVRYRAVEARAEVVALLRTDYPRDSNVRSVVDEVIAEMVFLGRTDGTFAQLGLRNAPRGLRWWWSALTGEDPDAVVSPAPAANPAAQLSLDDLATTDVQLAMDEIHGGYGDERG